MVKYKQSLWGSSRRDIRGTYRHNGVTPGNAYEQFALTTRLTDGVKLSAGLFLSADNERTDKFEHYRTFYSGGRAVDGRVRRVNLQGTFPRQNQVEAHAYRGRVVRRISGAYAAYRLPAGL